MRALARARDDTVIVVPGSLTSGTDRVANAGHPHDAAVAAAYDDRYAGLMDQVGARLAERSPADADPQVVAAESARVVGLAPGARPFRVHVDPADDGAESVHAVGDRVRRECSRRVGLEDLLAVQPG